MGLFARKPIADLLAEEGHPNALKRALGAGDLIMLAIGAVIGAGIFSSIGTAAAGEILPSGVVIRYGAGPALVISFILLGVVCGLAALCYAELASMIPQAGSAYAYSYATLGELIAWIIGWDLILEYAVGNVAVAVAWGGYFTSLLTAFNIHLPDFLTHGYRAALLSSDPAVHGLLQTAPRIAGIPILLNIPAFAIVMAITWLLMRGVKESARANNIMVIIKLLVLGLFVVVGAMHIDTSNYVPFAPNGWRGIHQGAAIVFFAYIGFDAISTAADSVLTRRSSSAQRSVRARSSRLMVNFGSPVQAETALRIKRCERRKKVAARSPSGAADASANNFFRSASKKSGNSCAYKRRRRR